METKELFSTGMLYKDFLDILTAKIFNYKTNFTRALVAEEDRAFFAGLGQLKVLVMAEPWCGDVVSILPVVARALEDLENVEMRIFLRSKNPALMDRYLTNGSKSVPKFAFFDENFREIAVWGPRPVKAQQVFDDVSQKIKNGLLKDGLLFLKVKEYYRKNQGVDIIKELKDLLSANYN